MLSVMAGAGVAPVAVAELEVMVGELNVICLAAPELVAPCVSALVMDAAVPLVALAAFALDVNDDWKSSVTPKQEKTCHSGLLTGDIRDMREQYDFMVQRVNKWKGFIAQKNYGDLYADTHNMLDIGKSFLRDLKNALSDEDSMKNKARRLSSDLAIMSAPVASGLVTPVLASFAWNNGAALSRNMFPPIISAAAMLSLTGCGDPCEDVKTEVHSALIRMRSNMNNALDYMANLRDCVSTTAPNCDTPMMKSQVTYIKQWLSAVKQDLKDVSYLNEDTQSSALLIEGHGTNLQILKLDSLLGTNVSSMVGFLSTEAEEIRSLAMKARRKQEEDAPHQCTQHSLQTEFGHVDTTLVVVVVGLIAVAVAVLASCTHGKESVQGGDHYSLVPEQGQFNTPAGAQGRAADAARSRLVLEQGQSSTPARAQGPGVDAAQSQLVPEQGQSSTPARAQGPGVDAAQSQLVPEQGQSSTPARAQGPGVDAAQSQLVPEQGQSNTPVRSQGPSAPVVWSKYGLGLLIVCLVMLSIWGGSFFIRKSDCPTKAIDLKSMHMWESHLMQMHSYMQTQCNCLQTGRCTITEKNDLRGELVLVVKNILNDMQVDAPDLHAALAKEEECLQRGDACPAESKDVHEKKVIVLTEKVAVKAIEGED